MVKPKAPSVKEGVRGWVIPTPGQCKAKTR